MITEQQSNPQPIRVMIVDDHMMVRDGLKAFLSIYPDIEVVAEAVDGEQALEQSRQHAPDVILMDVVMPNGDGPTTTARIRAALPQTQIIIVTGFVDDALVQRALRAQSAICSRTYIPTNSSRRFVMRIGGAPRWRLRRRSC